MRKVLLVSVFVLVPLTAFAGKIATIDSGPGTFSATVTANTGANPGFTFSESNMQQVHVAVNPPRSPNAGASVSMANTGAMSGVVGSGNSSATSGISTGGAP